MIEYQQGYVKSKSQNPKVEITLQQYTYWRVQNNLLHLKVCHKDLQMENMHNHLLPGEPAKSWLSSNNKNVF